MKTRIWPLVLTTLLLSVNSPAQNKPKKVTDDVPVVLIRGPYLQVATTSGITIRWRTDVRTRSLVSFGTSQDNLDKVAKDSALTNEHSVQLTGLTPYTKYYYSVEDFNAVLQQGADNYFFTLPDPGKEGLYRIGVFGDCGNNSVNQHSVKDAFINYLGKDYMNAWILLGDNAYSHGSDAEFQLKFFSVYKNDLLKKYPLFPTPGNHDYKDLDLRAPQAQKNHQIAYYQNFSMPIKGEAGGVPSGNQAFYSFDVGNIHFLSLDSYGIEDNQSSLYDTLGAQVRWVKKDLEANKNKGWVVAFWHHPPYTMGSHSSDDEDDLVKIRENFIRILERNGVDLILCGHSHVYERSRLMNGNYGMEASFNPQTHDLSSSTGLYDGSKNSCPYIKDDASQGTVYVVSGSAGQLGGKEKSFPHDAMFYSNADIGGACMLEVEGNRLDLKWICSDGKIRDQFTMMKHVNQHNSITVKKGGSVTLTASFNGQYHWNNGESTKSIIVKPKRGNTKYSVSDKQNCINDTFNVEVTD
ncbi:MAG: metallophosphoesterase family protein [Ferruginibacter sp.]